MKYFQEKKSKVEKKLFLKDLRELKSCYTEDDTEFDFLKRLISAIVEGQSLLDFADCEEQNGKMGKEGISKFLRNDLYTSTNYNTYKNMLVY